MSDIKDTSVHAESVEFVNKTESGFHKFAHSFTRHELALAKGGDESGAARVAASPLSRNLKGRHLQMIAIGGSIGTGLFVNSGKTLSNGGPASVLIAFMIIGVMLYTVVHALGELAVCIPVAGSFSTFSTRFIDPAWGFAMGWNYAMQWLVVFPLELVAASITLQYWNVPVNKTVWVAIFWTFIVIINLFGVKGYAEAEFAFSLVKVVSVIMFIIVGIVINCGGAPEGGYIGGKYWHNPGAFNNGLKGLCAVFVTAAFAFAGTELVGLASAETANPRKTLPSAVKQVFWRITVFYIVALTVVGLLVPYDSDRLLGASSHVDAAASPFVIAMQGAGLKAFPHVMNAIILIAVLSVGNSSVYGCSRTLASLADLGQAPRFLGYIDRAGRPLAAIGVTAVFGLLGFVCVSPAEGPVFNWLLSLSGLSSIFTWGSICFAHIRFRAALRAQGYQLTDLAFQSQPGVIGSSIGLAINIFVLGAQIWTAFSPTRGHATIESVLQDTLTVPVVIMLFVCYKVWRRTSFVAAADADLVSGRREVDPQVFATELEAERAELASRGLFYRAYKFWC
ncbi:amino acid permease/ SLC12A domain-containing protein [Lipomyces arxii]|uniref:amino acid permease/ SLC12A domain-containing protein n=1 Tax=Lipomyces arxii TaxID=56418 RepID=UPI0034CFFBDC